MPIPPYPLFRRACAEGLSTVRPLLPEARGDDHYGWNFGTGWPPSHAAFGRMRFLRTLGAACTPSPSRILEVAAGGGALSACLARDGAMVVTNDLRENELRQALSQYENGGSITIAPGNLFALDPASLGQFDLVIACEVLEHVAHPDDLLRHLRRFLTPSGRLLLTTPNGAYFRNRLPTLATITDHATLEAHQFKPDADGHLFLITPAELKALAARAGLEIATLELFGTPLITGHCQLSLLQTSRLTRVCYLIEAACNRLPAGLRARLFFGLLAVMVCKDFSETESSLKP